MSGIAPDDAIAQVRVEGDVLDKKIEDVQDQNEMGGMPSRQEEEAVIKKKYGGILPRKTPLISKDHERAYFDSADWALGKQGGVPNKPKGPLEALRPKLQEAALMYLVYYSIPYSSTPQSSAYSTECPCPPNFLCICGQ
ncbi:unnamed protein product [Urochloa decumbens]|uniref:cAMP-regulated phosphoprotein 19-related protein n=1 Tax=Urochloa decumbens TaxID=240449 RepID=A0ABC9H0T1_9POAL